MHHSIGIVVKASIFISLISAVAVPAEAKRPILVTGPSSGVITKEVSYRDLDLASRSGERKFTRRVASAVSEVCNDLNPTSRVHIQNVCRSEAWRGVRPLIKQAVRRSHQFAASNRALVAVGAITFTFAK